MARVKIDWLGILSTFVRDHPKTSAIVAFNLGLMAATASKKARGVKLSVSDMAEIPAKLIELVPSIKEIGALMPGVATKKIKSPRKSRNPLRGRTVARR